MSVELVYTVCGTVRWYIQRLMITRMKFTAFLRSVWIIGDEVRLFQLATVAHMILLGKWILVEFFGLCDYWSILLVFGSVSILKSAKGNYNTCYSQVVSHPSTKQANTRLTSEIRRDPVQLVCMVVAEGNCNFGVI